VRCDDFKRGLHDYFRGALPPAESEALEAHVTDCADCAALMAWARELSCQEFTEFLNDYVDDEMPPERRQVFDHHLELCEDCRNYLQSYRVAMKQSALALGTGLDALAEPVPEDLILAVLEAARRKRGS
jgi:anti-sigma factor RsiW